MKFFSLLSLFYLAYAVLMFLSDMNLELLSFHIMFNFNLMLINTFFKTYSNIFECLSSPTKTKNF